MCGCVEDVEVDVDEEVDVEVDTLVEASTSPDSGVPIVIQV